MSVTLDTYARLRFQEKSCANCRFYREHKTSAVVSECLALGRTLGIQSANEAHILTQWARERLCDLWKKRPASWVIFSEGVDKNPHFHDPYISRATNERRRARLEKQALKSDAGERH